MWPNGGVTYAVLSSQMGLDGQKNVMELNSYVSLGDVDKTHLQKPLYIYIYSNVCLKVVFFVFSFTTTKSLRRYVV